MSKEEIKNMALSLFMVGLICGWLLGVLFHYMGWFK